MDDQHVHNPEGRPKAAMSRRTFLRLASAGGMLAALAACGAPAPTTPQGGAEPTTAPPAQGGNEKIALRLWHWDSFMLEPYEAEAQAFNQQNPDITVAVEITPWDEYSQKMGAAVTGGTPPDVVGIVGEHFTNLASKNQLVNLSSYISRDNFDLKDFHPTNLKQNTWKGTLVGLPYTADGMWVFYNIDEFEKRGLETPTELWKAGKWNWNTYLDLAARLTSGEGVNKVWGSGNISPTNEFLLPPLIYSNGGDLFDADFTRPTITEPKAAAAYQFAYDVRKFAPGPDDSQTGTPESGKVMMWIDWEPWYQLNVDRVPFKYSVAPPPASPDTGINMFCGDAPGFGIAAGAKQPDAAWEFIKFLMSPESLTRVFMAANSPPPRMSMTASPDLWKQNPQIADPQLLYEIAQARWKAFRNNPKMSNWVEVWTAHNEELTLVWADEQTLDEGLAKVSERWTGLLAEADIDSDAN